MTALYTLVEEIDFPQELIVNASAENLVEELKRHHASVRKKLEHFVMSQYTIGIRPGRHHP